jgi:hypothetical protein
VVGATANVMVAEDTVKRQTHGASANALKINKKNKN